jgi:hypothetical protein
VIADPHFMVDLDKGSRVHVTTIAHGKDCATGYQDGYSRRHALSHELVTNMDRASEPEPYLTEYYRLLPERASSVAPGADRAIRYLYAIQKELAAPCLCRPEILHGLCLIS